MSWQMCHAPARPQPSLFPNPDTFRCKPHDKISTGFRARCDAGDSPCRRGGGCAGAVAGWAVESRQMEKLPESAAPARLSGGGRGRCCRGGKRAVRWPANGAGHCLKVHGTLNKKSREFIGIRVPRCDTGDSPCRQCGRRAGAVAGRAVESSQTEELPESATPAPLPGRVPAVADYGGNAVGGEAGKRCWSLPKSAWHLQRKFLRIYWHPRHSL